MTDSPETSPRRPRRRAAPADAVEPAPERSRAYRHLTNPFEPLKVFSADQVEAMHEAALGLLENTGWKVLSDRAINQYAASGATVDRATQMVKIDRGLVAKALATVPEGFDMHALDPDRMVRMRGRHVVIPPVYGEERRETTVQIG